MNSPVRLQVPGGMLSAQELRELVGWAGSWGVQEVMLGDRQDLLLEGRSAADPPPPGFRLSVGSVQASAFGETPSPSYPWLTEGVWSDLVASLPDPGPLDVQLLHEPALPFFVRQGHLRLVAQKAPHQWELTLRRPGRSTCVSSTRRFDTGTIPGLVEQALAALRSGDAAFWAGSPPSAPPPSFPLEHREGFHSCGPARFSFGLRPSSARLTIVRLRDLLWMADGFPARIRLLPDRTLVFEDLPIKQRGAWEQWLHRQQVPAVHGDIDHAVVAAGWSPSVWSARHEVVDWLRSHDRLPTARILVAEEALEQEDGACAHPFSLLIRRVGAWGVRSGDGSREGEGSLEEVLDSLAASDPRPAPSALAPATSRTAHQCPHCLTLYEAAWGDPCGGVAPGTPFDELPPSWVCPVCAAPRSEWTRVS